MTASELYRQALADVGNHDGRYGVSRCKLADGSEVICSTNAVAGRSIVAKHRRTTWRLTKAGDQYSKLISQKCATELLRCDQRQVCG